MGSMAVLDDVDVLAEVQGDEDDDGDDETGLGGRGSTSAMWLWVVGLYTLVMIVWRDRMGRYLEALAVN